MALSMTFKKEYTFDERFDEAQRVLSKYPDRVPIICERINIASKDTPNIDKKKYLVPRDLNMGQFLYVIRKRIKLPSEKALFLFVKGRMISNAVSISDAYETNKDADGFMYINYSCENTFG